MTLYRIFNVVMSVCHRSGRLYTIVGQLVTPWYDMVGHTMQRRQYRSKTYWTERYPVGLTGQWVRKRDLYSKFILDDQKKNNISSLYSRTKKSFYSSDVPPSFHLEIFMLLLFHCRVWVQSVFSNLSQESSRYMYKIGGRRKMSQKQIEEVLM